MQDSQPTLLLTRPKEQSAEFLSECEKHADRRLPVVVSPIIRIEAVADVPDLSSYATLIFTSANGVVACASELRGRRVVTVGTKACVLAAQAGAVATSLGEDVETFLAQSDQIEGPALHCRGTHARGNLAERLSANGVQTDEAILYDQVAQPLTPAARSLLQSNGSVVAPIFSPRSAQLLSQTMISADIQIVAMSEAVAQAWSGTGAVTVVSEPTALEMAMQTIRRF